MKETLMHTHVEKYVEEKEVRTAHILVLNFAIKVNANHVNIKAL